MRHRLLPVVLAASTLSLGTAALVEAGPPGSSLCRSGAWADIGFASQGQCVRSEASQTLWSAADDFRLSPGQENPSRDRYGRGDVWAYMSATDVSDPSTYQLLPQWSVEPPDLGVRQVWSDPDPTGEFWRGYPFVGSGEGWTYLRVHPDEYPSELDDAAVLLRWKSHIDGYVRVTGEVFDANPGTADYYVDGVEWVLLLRHGPSVYPITSASFDNGGWSDFPDGLVVEVVPGAELILAVTPQVNYVGDSTNVSMYVTALPQNTKAWNIGNDYLAYPAQQNPSPDRYGHLDTWSYMAAAPDDLSNLEAHQLMGTYYYDPNGGEGWTYYDPVHESWGYPVVWGHSGGSGWVGIHPGDGNAYGGGDLAIVRWTAPIDATVQVVGIFYDGDPSELPLPDGVDVWILHNDQVIASYWIEDGSDPLVLPAGLTADVVAGDTITLAVGPGENSLNDYTNVMFSIITI